MLHVGSVVTYESATKGPLRAVIVKGPNIDGTWDLDVKAGVLPSRITCAHPQLENNPSIACAPPAPNGLSFGSEASAPVKTQEVLYRSAGAHRPVGTVCFYKSASRGWIPARVVRYCCQSGTYDLDCKAQAAIECIFWIDEGSSVEYYSSSQSAWIAARVLRAGTRPGTFDLDCKEAAEVQFLRPRGSDTAEKPTPATLQAMPGMMCYGVDGVHVKHMTQGSGKANRIQPGILTHVLGPKPTENAGLLTRVLGPKPKKDSGILERMFGPDHSLFEWGEEDNDEDNDDDDEDEGEAVMKQVRFSGEITHVPDVSQQRQPIEVNNCYDDVPLMTGAVDMSKLATTSNANPYNPALVDNGRSFSNGYQAPPTDLGAVPPGDVGAPFLHESAMQQSFRFESQSHHGVAPPLNHSFQQQSFRLDNESDHGMAPQTDPKLQGCIGANQLSPPTTAQAQLPQFAVCGHEVSPTSVPPFRAAPPVFQMSPITFGGVPPANVQTGGRIS